MPTVVEKRNAFCRLHVSGCFAIPNPWDVGTARYLQHLGFKALATTSAGFAWSQARPDNHVTLEAVLAHLREIAVASDVPVNADFESGFASTPEGVATNVRRAVETGISGLSIEDSTGDPANPLMSIDVAVARMCAARAAIDATRSGVMLTGRAENFFVGRADLDDTIRRLKAYAEAGAQCLYSPGIRTPEQIAEVVKAVTPKPVNLLVGSTSDLTMKQIADLGVRRVSVGGGLALSAWEGFIRAAKAIATDGSFKAFAGAAPGRELNSIFAADAKGRAS